MADDAAPEDPAIRLARLQEEIEQARRTLSTLRHEGERHFIDDQPVHPEVPDLLQEVVDRYERLRRLQGAPGQERHVNPPFPPGSADEATAGLHELEERIARLRQMSVQDKHGEERRFIDWGA